MSMGVLRRFNNVDLEGILLNVPLILFEYYILSTLFLDNRICLLLTILLLVLGVFFNRYTGVAALLVLSYTAYILNIQALLFASIWLIGIAFSRRTRFLDKLLSYMFILLFNTLLVPHYEHIYLLISMIPVLLYLSVSLERRSLVYLSISLLLISTIIVLSRITNSIFSLNMFAFSTIVSIYLAYKAISVTTEA